MAADMTMLIGNGCTPGHADLDLYLYRRSPGVRALIDPRVRA
jgi:L-erythro-3,5-diaminohexanoate dehydrogenase